MQVDFERAGTIEYDGATGLLTFPAVENGPGVYVMHGVKDGEYEVYYVGETGSLRDRINRYQRSADPNAPYRKHEVGVTLELTNHAMDGWEFELLIARTDLIGTAPYAPASEAHRESVQDFLVSHYQEEGEYLINLAADLFDHDEDGAIHAAWAERWAARPS